MTITVITFATLADRLGFDRRDLELSDNATVAQALDELIRACPTLAESRDRIATAVNLTYVGPEHRLRAGDELALIPPVSGG